MKIPASIKEELKDVLAKLDSFNDADMHNVIVKVWNSSHCYFFQMIISIFLLRKFKRAKFF